MIKQFLTETEQADFTAALRHYWQGDDEATQNAYFRAAARALIIAYRDGATITAPLGLQSFESPLLVGD